MNPLLIDVPDRVTTPRLLLRVPRAGDGTILHASLIESLPRLGPWMPWATADYTPSHAETWCRSSASEFISRASLSYLLFLPGGQHIGGCGTEPINWDVPSAGLWYWLRTGCSGNGYMSEAVPAIVKLILEHLKLARVEVRIDERNLDSARLAERCGFQLEGTLRHDYRYPDGRLRNTRIYSRLGGA